MLQFRGVVKEKQYTFYRVPLVLHSATYSILKDLIFLKQLVQ